MIIAEIFVKYGFDTALLVLLLILSIFIFRVLYKLDGRINVVEADNKLISNSVDTVHDGCHISASSYREMRKDIKDLQDQDNSIVIQLTEMNTTLTQTNSMTTQLFNQLVTKGIDSGRRKEDK